MSAPALLACAASALALGLPVIGAASALEAHHRVAAAADSAALAAADAVGGWIDAVPCDLAASVVTAAATTLTECTVDAASGVVRISVNVYSVFGPLDAAARAGPPGIE